jgi:hypothetical protein
MNQRVPTLASRLRGSKTRHRSRRKCEYDRTAQARAREQLHETNVQRKIVNSGQSGNGDNGSLLVDLDAALRLKPASPLPRGPAQQFWI